MFHLVRCGQFQYVWQASAFVNKVTNPYRTFSTSAFAYKSSIVYKSSVIYKSSIIYSPFILSQAEKLLYRLNFNIILVCLEELEYIPSQIT